MKTQNLLFALASLLLLPLLSIAQPYGHAVWEDNATSTYYFVEVDLATGWQTNVNNIPGVNAYGSPNTATINSATNEYSFVGYKGATPYYITLDIATGNVVYENQLMANIVGIQYNCANGLLYALEENNNQYRLVTVDPATAVVTPVGGFINGLSAYSGGTFSLDPNNGRFSFVGLSATFTLYSLDINTGGVLYSNSFSDNVVGHEYDYTSDTLYGMWENQGNGTYNLESIDVTTGTHTTVATLAGVKPGYVSDATTFNPQTGEYSFLGFDGGNNLAMIVVDVNNGNVLHNYPYVFSPGFTGLEVPTSCPNVSPPMADFTADTLQVIQGGQVNFTDLSGNGPTGWNWIFDNGTPGTSTDQNPQMIQYNTPGCFDVTLMATNGNGTDTLMKTCYIDVLPQVPVGDFSANTQTIQTGGSVDFMDLSTNSPTIWIWSFQGGTPPSSTQQHPTGITYAQAGCYDVSLQVANGTGADTVSQTCYITVEDQQPNGIAPISNHEVSVYPNPAVDQITFSAPHGLRIQHLALYNVHGQQLQLVNGKANQLTLSKGQLPAGVYWVQLSLENGARLSKKVVWLLD